jgi:hypothetical protein
MLTDDARCTREIKFRITMAKVASNNNNKTSLQHNGLKEEPNTMLHLEHSFFMVLKLGYLGKQIRNAWKVLKCGAGEGWRSV